MNYLARFLTTSSFFVTMAAVLCGFGHQARIALFDTATVLYKNPAIDACPEVVVGSLEKTFEPWLEIFNSYRAQWFNGYAVRTRMVGKDRQANGILLLPCVHGTGSSEASYGVDESRIVTQYIIKLAKKLSTCFDMAVQIVSFTWSGKLRRGARDEAAYVLAEYIKTVVQENPEKIKQIWSIAHSHGANVVLSAAEALKGITEFDVGLFAASPDVDVTFASSVETGKFVPEDDAYNIKTIFHFYSSCDLIQICGSLQNCYSTMRKIPLRITQDRKVYNIRLQADGVSVVHKTILPFMVKYSLELMHVIEKNYPYYLDLDANVPANENAHQGPLVSIRTAALWYPHKVELEELCKTIAYSDAAKRLYKSLYNRLIWKKPRGFTAPFKMLWDEFQARRLYPNLPYL